MPPASKEKLAELTKARDDAAKAVEDAMKAIRSREKVFRGKLRRLRSDREETAAALDAFGKDGTTRVLAMGVQASASAPVTAGLQTSGVLDYEHTHDVFMKITGKHLSYLASTARNLGFTEKGSELYANA